MPLIAALPEATRPYADNWRMVIESEGSPDSTQFAQWSDVKDEIHSRTVAIPVMAPAIRPRSTGGCADLAEVSAGSGKPDIISLDFDASTAEYAQFSIVMPSSWNESTITAKFVWSHAATATNFDCVWGIQAVAIGNDDAMNATFGTAVTVTDTGGTTDDCYITAATSSMTVGGTPAAGDVVVFQVFRDATAGADNLAVDGRLMGVQLFITMNAANDS